MHAVFLKTRGKAGASRWRHTCLDTIEPFAEKLVCVGPCPLPRLILKIFARASVLPLYDYFSHQRILHDDTR